MAEQLFWTNTQVAIANLANIGSAIELNSISKAAQGVCAYSGTDTLADGDWVLIECQGMVEVNYRLFRVDNLDTVANTFELEGEDTTGYRTFTSGTAKKVTFNLSFTTLSEPQASGGDPVTEDTTTIHDVSDTEAIVSTSPQGYSFTSRYSPDDAAVLELQRAYVSRTARPLLITFSSGAKFAFFATVAAPLAPSASGRKVTTPVSMRLKGTGTNYAT